MARGVLTPHAIVRGGTALAAETTGDASNGHTVVNDGTVFVLAHNTNGASTARTVTFIIKGKVDGIAPTAVPHSLAAGATFLYGPFDTQDYGEALDIDVSNAEMKLSAYSFVAAS